MRNRSAYMWGLLGKLGPQIIYLCTTFVLARFITPADFGQIGILTILTSVSQTLLEAGLGGSLIKEEKVSAIDYSTIFVFNIIVSFLLYIIIFFSSPWIQSFYGIYGLATVCRVLCLVFVINSWGQIAQTVLFRELRFKALMISSVVSVLTGSVIALVGAIWLKWGVYSLVAYQLTQSSTYVISNWHRCSFKPSFQFSTTSFKKLFSFGFYTTIIGIIESVYENLITSLFGKYLGVNQAGFFSQAKRIETASVSSLSGTVNSVAFPILTRLKSNKTDFEIEATSLLRNLSLIVIPLLLCISLLSDLVVTILFGKEWIKAAPYLSILMWVGCFFVLESANRNFIKSLGYVRTLLKITIVKRLFGIAIMGFCIVYDSSVLIYGYLIGAIIGYFANAFCYSNIIGSNIISYSLSSLKYTLIPIMCFSVGIALKYIICSSSSDYILIVSSLFLVYYTMVLPRIGINIFKFLEK